jgi:hypothetical protein
MELANPIFDENPPNKKTSEVAGLQRFKIGGGGPLFHSLDEVEPMVSNLRVVKSRSA